MAGISIRTGGADGRTSSRWVAVAFPVVVAGAVTTVGVVVVTAGGDGCWRENAETAIRQITAVVAKTLS